MESQASASFSTVRSSPSATLLSGETARSSDSAEICWQLKNELDKVWGNRGRGWGQYFLIWKYFEFLGYFWGIF